MNFEFSKGEAVDVFDHDHDEEGGEEEFFYNHQLIINMKMLRVKIMSC